MIKDTHISSYLTINDGFSDFKNVLFNNKFTTCLNTPVFQLFKTKQFNNNNFYLTISDIFSEFKTSLFNIMFTENPKNHTSDRILFRMRQYIKNLQTDTVYRVVEIGRARKETTNNNNNNSNSSNNRNSDNSYCNNNNSNNCRYNSEDKSLISTYTRIYSFYEYIHTCIHSITRVPLRICLLLSLATLTGCQTKNAFYRVEYIDGSYEYMPVRPDTNASEYKNNVKAVIRVTPNEISEYEQ